MKTMDSSKENNDAGGQQNNKYTANPRSKSQRQARRRRAREQQLQAFREGCELSLIYILCLLERRTDDSDASGVDESQGMWCPFCDGRGTISDDETATTDSSFTFKNKRPRKM